jgi:hypothetical protein
VTAEHALPLERDCEPGDIGPGIYDGDISLAPWSNTSVEDLGGVRCITGSVYIDRTSLVDLSAFRGVQTIRGGLHILDNDNLASVAGLESLRSVGGPLDIAGNDALTDLAHLGALTEVGGYPNYPAENGWLHVMNNGQLPACWAWAIEAQTGVGCGQPDWRRGWLDCVDNLGQGSCGSLPADFACVPGAKGPGVYDGSLWITPWNDGPGLDELGGLTCVTGVLAIYGTAASHLDELSGLRMVGGSLMISDNLQLSTLHGLESLESVGEQLSISNNPQLTSLASLANVTRLGEMFAPGLIGDALWLANNPQLSDCWIEAIERQTDTRCGQHDGLGNAMACARNAGPGACEAWIP